MRKPIALSLICAVVFGLASPVLNGLAVNDDFARIPFIFEWFHLLPGQVSYWLNPESNVTFLVLGMAVQTVQYLMLFALGTYTLRMARLAHNFLRAPRDRSGLVRR